MELNWSQSPPHGTCIICGTSQNDMGFVDFIGDVFAVNKDGLTPELGVVVNIIICASCIHQASRVVGGASPDEVDKLVQQVSQGAEREEALQNEIDLLEQRFADVLKLDMDDLVALKELKERSRVAPDPDISPR